MAHPPRMLLENEKTLQSIPPADNLSRKQTGSSLDSKSTILADRLNTRRLPQNRRVASKDYSIHLAAFRLMQHIFSLHASPRPTILILILSAIFYSAASLVQENYSQPSSCRMVTSHDDRKPDQQHLGQDSYSSHHLHTKTCPPKSIKSMHHPR
ncbi:hypothetical protein EDD18DRAFT_340927 [Armillaria luteobubalina]|uniref:Uncharacterized protein n=1 Tax=Armillaria luteobubalina TaxID=153913 RepID=A0AA39Q2Y2_9AGAR|nr:hypothetical protein EDD18DRAFT_340927 [Armillaria luteobubalina]